MPQARLRENEGSSFSRYLDQGMVGALVGSGIGPKRDNQIKARMHSWSLDRELATQPNAPVYFKCNIWK